MRIKELNVQKAKKEKKKDTRHARQKQACGNEPIAMRQIIATSARRRQGMLVLASVGPLPLRLVSLFFMTTTTATN
ncbi:hypothetical protein BX661DRAFT_73170 [Kickxella alabastrina]|uniref:uncharacterized protein n=1 Tax=Kickxella alabastrina TaxID=61397 RepID=UPI00221FC71E|nr:uncharacterized protein BX661DRAFT_73170 [Kickxella alabastrina]KAI7833333.1 hypothetical protein BX661DRAFT_73170 [Kickxella alabastrina]